MTASDSFPPAAPPADKAKYRQFLIDHGLDPNLNAEDLGRAVEGQTEAERAQLHKDWGAFLAAQ